MNEKNNFDEIFTDAVYEGLCLIDSLAVPMVFMYLTDVGRMRLKLNIQDAVSIEKCLERIFGFGAKVFEKKILDILYAKIQLIKEIEQNFKFSNEVKKASELYNSKLHTLRAQQ